MDKNTKFVLAIFASIMFPGLGNIIYGQTKLGIILFLVSFFLSGFYLLPLLFMLVDKNQQVVVLGVTSAIACIALIIDIALIIFSIIKFKKLK